MSQLRNKKMKIVFESLQFEKFSLSLFFFFFFRRGQLVERVKRLKMSWQENENSLLDQETKVYFYFHFLKRYKRQRQCVCFYYFHFPNVKRKRERVCGLKRLGRIGGVIDVDCRQIDFSIEGESYFQDVFFANSELSLLNHWSYLSKL